jgi:hypothetical protein
MIYNAQELLDELKELKRKGVKLDRLTIVVMPDDGEAEYDQGIELDIAEELDQLLIGCVVS